MTRSASKKPEKAGRWSRLAATAAAVGLSVGIANGMALAANSDAAPIPAAPPSVIRRIVVSEPRPIVVMVPRTVDASTETPARIAATATQPPAPTPPPAVQTPAPAPVSESSGS